MMNVSRPSNEIERFFFVNKRIRFSLFLVVSDHSRLGCVIKRCYCRKV